MGATNAASRGGHRALAIPQSFLHTRSNTPSDASPACDWLALLAVLCGRWGRRGGGGRRRTWASATPSPLQALTRRFLAPSPGASERALCGARACVAAAAILLAGPPSRACLPGPRSACVSLPASPPASLLTRLMPVWNTQASAHHTERERAEGTSRCGSQRYCWHPAVPHIYPSERVCKCACGRCDAGPEPRPAGA